MECLARDKSVGKFFIKKLDKLKNLFIFAVLVLFVFHNWAHLNDRLVIGGFFLLHLLNIPIPAPVQNKQILSEY